MIDRRVEYKGRFYISSLIVIISVLLVVNLYMLLYNFVYLSIIPLIIQSSVLFMIIMKHQNVEKWISGWSILMMLPGALWILTFFVGKIGNVDPFEHAGMRIDYIFETAVRIVLMIIGAYYYVTVDDYVQPYFSKDLFKKSSDVS